MTHANVESVQVLPTPTVLASKRHPFLCRALLVLSLGLALPSLADDDCDVPVALWQTREAALQMAVAQGWQVRRLKIDDGCYEIKGSDAHGRPFKAKLDPQTLAIVKFKHKNHDGKHSHRAAAAHPGASSDPGSGNSPLESTTATPPREPID